MPNGPMIKLPVNEAKDRLPGLLRDAVHEEVLITRHGRPAGILIGFEDEDDWFECRLENDERFLRRIAKSRDQVTSGETIHLEDLPD
jgi:prevent-host-death family protein